MASKQTTVFRELNLTCSVHCNDLIPLFCKECDQLLCCECVTSDHAGHTFCNVSEVAKDHQRELQGVLNSEKSIQFLDEVVNSWQGEQNRLPMHTKDLLRNVSDKEDEIIRKVTMWRQTMTDMIIQFRELRDKYFNDKIITLTGFLNMNQESFQLELEKHQLEIIHINCAVQHLLADTKVSEFDTSDLIDIEMGSSNGELPDFFGKIYISEKETSSDEITCNEAEQVVEIGHLEDEEEEFYDCVDLHRYKFRSDSITDIIPVQNLQTLLLSSGTVYLCDLNKCDFDARTILSNVHQIANIPPSGDVLCVMKDFKEIKRISKWNMVTRFMCTTKKDELFRSVSSGGDEAYACASQENCYTSKYLSLSLPLHTSKYALSNSPTQYHYKINLFDEYGVILKTFDVGIDSDVWSLMKIRTYNKCIRRKPNKVEMIDLTHYGCEKTYEGSIGTNPRSSFCTTGMTTDNNNNILLAVYNDNAIHLLDSSLTFQKLLMTAEDGLHCPSSVALDSDGYLWVGCEDGQLHIVNYQYLVSTNRQARLKL